MSFPKYPSYKDSGVEWLGSVPSHWDLRRTGNFFEERREKVSDTDFSALSVTKGGVVPQLETAAKTDDGDNRKKVCVGDFVINSRSDRKGSSGLSPLDGSVSLINTVIKPRAEINGKFAHHLFRSTSFQEEYYRYGKGIVADLWTTNYSEMKNITLAMPPISEQTAIVNVLDHETAKIDSLIAEQEKLIELLKEKRQAVISHAVTKGLDPNVKMKDSGVEWLGEIPEHWKIHRIKKLLNILTDYTANGSFASLAENVTYLDSGYARLVRLTDLREDLKNDGLYVDENAHNFLKKSELFGGEVLIANVGAYAGFACLMPHIDSKATLGPNMYMMNFNNKLLTNEYALYCLMSFHAQEQLKIAATSTAQPKLNKDDVKNVWITLPPSLEEQEAVMLHIRKRSGQFDELIDKATAAIDLLEERRSALISAAVTGQIDVRDFKTESQAA